MILKLKKFVMFNNKFSNEIMQLDNVWLRKEIIKKARSKNKIQNTNIKKKED